MRAPESPSNSRGFGADGEGRVGEGERVDGVERRVSKCWPHSVDSETGAGLEGGTRTRAVGRFPPRVRRSRCGGIRITVSFSPFSG